MMHRTELTCNLSSPEIGRVKTPAMTNSHIPVPKPFGVPNKSTLHSSTKRGNLNTADNKAPQSPTLQRMTSVAAQRASFERLDASAASASPKINRFHDLNSPISNFQTKDNGQQFPIKKIVSNSRYNGSSNNNNNNLNLEVNWKLKYEESERKRKVLLQKSETVSREHSDLEKKHRQLLRENSALQSQNRDKDEQLQKLRTVSEAVCKEYEQLKRQYDVETGAMHKAMQQASQWYKQNRQLKRRSQVLVQRILDSRPDALADDSYLSDEVDANDADDAEELRQTITELSAEVARLQTELNAARLQEFEAQEQAALTNARLEDEKEISDKNNEVIKQLTIHKENMERVSRMVAEEVQALKAQCDRERESAKLMKIEADRIQKERNVLAHQSALLMAEVGDDPNGRLLTVLQEVESLKRLLEEEKQEHLEQIQLLQDKLDEKESNVEFEIVEEKLKLAEVELNMMQERAERAEKDVFKLQETVRKLEDKINQLETMSLSSPPPPPPPMPAPLPPPPPPLPSTSRTSTVVKLLTKERLQEEQNRHSAIVDMENMLGISKKSVTAVPQQPAIDDIINQIKGGRFTLKQTDKQREEERKRKREMESAPAAVSEMLNILGTMRRRAKPVRQSINSSELASSHDKGAQ
ncbi:shootin-1 isoform X2 [Microplitis demolitor]|nr:shootin-1 isoform X2 [Microplitis demolitor]XP_008546706.1 shootin-1 isoform X2 [Microplitis demolitor]XP_008546707.1 shootin-1 isoform X2 [Microplitis demolitor]XP_008546708.1 shootin-1 isoform X2 [Microplitis demolitor]